MGAAIAAASNVASASRAAASSAAASSTAASTTVGPPPTSTAGVLATPATRKLARELGVDLTRVNGTGRAGRITSDDVRAMSRGATNAGSPDRSAGPGWNGGARPQPAFAPPLGVQAGDVRVPFRGLRRRIAEQMVRSRREAAHFTYVEEVDCTQLVELRDKANARMASDPGGLRLSFLPFIVRSTVEALRRFPQMNAYLDEAAGEIVQRRQYHIGLATATPDGLIVPVVRDADRRSILDLAREIDRLAKLTRSGKASRDDLSGSTFTITSLGALGGVLATPILNYPEVGHPGGAQNRPASGRGGR